MSQDRNTLAVFGSQLIGVLIVIISLLTQQGELHSVRPPNRAIISPAAKTDRFVRLWDDPLEDMQMFQADSEEQSNPATKTTRASESQQSPSPAESAPVRTATPSAPSCIFLWNILDARPLPEVRERRLRIRYAIVSAILAGGYLPVHESALSSLFEDNRLVGHFETFRKAADQGNWPCVCVIWTPKQSTHFPLPEADFKDEIRKRDGISAQGDIQILHHGSSDDLYKYIAASPEPSPKPNLAFVRATIPLKRLGVPNWQTWSYLQKITTDDKLVDALFQELRLRIPALRGSGKTPRVVVFTESDSSYSRAIASQLRKKFKGKVSFEVYTYLRALDGRSEDTHATETSESSKSQDIVTSFLQGRAISETSFGTSQFDYLRRLALRLQRNKQDDRAATKTDDSAIKKQNERVGEIVAVGILGSDIYDKMLVLQAVRPELHSAVFFTTDLDGLYLERTMEPFTRNLVVASADDLDANNSDDGASKLKLPPMRDSYQTVLVKEIQNILVQNKLTETRDQTLPPIFEIALGKSVELTPASESIAPSLLRYLPWLSFIILLLALGNGFLILWAISTRQPEQDAQMVTSARKLVGIEIALGCIGLFFLLYMLCMSRVPSLFGEPLSLGVSIWPSVMIRLLAFVVAIVLLCLASYSFVVYGLPQKQKLKTALAGHVEFRSRDGLWDLWGKSSIRSFDDFANDLFDSGARRRRIKKVSLVYLAFSFVLFAIWPPTVPTRGALPFLIEKIVLSLGVALYIIHLVYCLDLHVSAFSLLRNLRSHYHSAVDEKSTNSINGRQMLAAVGTLTIVIGKTLLYPLTVLILIILSRLTIFDNWVMTPSLMITFALGALVLIAASLVLWSEGSKLKNIVLAQDRIQSDEKEKLKAINDGVFAAWYSQPIFSAILSAVAVFGSLTVAGPLTRLFLGAF